MKVLSITNLIYGYSVTLPERALYKGLVAKGVDLTIIADWQTTESQELESAGIKVIYLPILKKIDFRVIKKLRDLIREEKFDILHMTYGKAITNGLIASWGLKIKIVVYLGSLNVHWYDPFTYLSFLNRNINKLICLSNSVEDHILKQAPQRMKGKTVRIYKGYDPSWIKDVKPADKKSINIPENAMIVCCVAVVRRIKGVQYLIKAVDFLPDNLPVYFLLIGMGLESASIKNQIDSTKYRDHFRVLGFTNEVLSYTSICDVYIQPSLTEGLGRSVIEAMCLGKPVIVTNNGGTKELVIEGVNGYVVPVKSPRAIAERIFYCYQNREVLSGMGEKARERIRNDFGPQPMIDQTYKVFNDLLEQ